MAAREREKMIEPKVSQRLARIVSERRARLGLTQAELGRRVGYKYGNYIAMIENMSSAFPVEKWRSYANALDIDEIEFLKIVIDETFHPDLQERIVTVYPDEKTAIDRFLVLYRKNKKKLGLDFDLCAAE
ncbi:MAG: helix-turn-helix domain-containing protein [Acidobacteriota bacterium]